MRIVIAGTQKSGNVWLKCLLAHAYDLRVLVYPDIPRRPTLDAFRAWESAGGFVDGSVFHHHFQYSDELADAFDAVPAHVTTIVRDPYDTFVSYFHSVQRRKGRGFKRDALIGKPLDHPDVLAFLRDGGYQKDLRLAMRWVKNGRSTVVRYEDLHRNPVEALSRVADSFGAVPPVGVECAVESCRAENMQSLDFVRRQHVRSAKVGDSRQYLSGAHLEIFRDRYGSLIEALGYPVR